MRSLRYLPRTILTYILGVVATVLGATAVLVIARFSPTHPILDRVARLWSWVWLTSAGVELVIEGREHLDTEKSYVVVANHISNLDVMACFIAVPVPIRFLAKKELFSIPLFSSAMRSIGMVEVDRASPSPVHDQINKQARSLIDAGRSIIIYPEGTRARGGELAAFKKGAFTIAVATGLPILPVTINGSYEAWPPSNPIIRGGTITVTIEEAIPTTGLTQADTTALRDRTRQVIATHYLTSGAPR